MVPVQFRKERPLLWSLAPWHATLACAARHVCPGQADDATQTKLRTVLQGGLHVIFSTIRRVAFDVESTYWDRL